MKLLAALCAGLLCACSAPVNPALLPPPFGPDEDSPEPARLFFPTGIVITNGWVVVSNSNADRLYDAGATYSLRATDLLKYFTPDSPVPQCAQDPTKCDAPFPSSLVQVQLGNAAITGNYTGPMVSADGPLPGQVSLYSASRDTNRLNALALDTAHGRLTCRGPAPVANATPPDCRNGSIDLNNTAQVEGPFGVAVGTVRSPIDTSDAAVVMVTSLIPRVDDVQSGLLLTSAHIAALDQADPTRILFTATVTNRLNGNGVGGGPMVFDDRSREAIISGCFTRFASASAGGEPSTLKCGSTLGASSLLRFVPMDAGSAASTRFYNLSAQIRSTDTTGLALGGLDPATGARTLYLANRNPDTVARVSIPTDPAFGPFVQATATVSSQPSQILLLQRPAGSSGSDLLAVTGFATYGTSTAAGKLLLIDGSRGRVVGQVDDIGDTPFDIAQFPPAPGDASARLAITLFGSCSVSLIDVPFDQPGQASLRARIGSCPQ